jgi:hypothetical protein
VGQESVINSKSDIYVLWRYIRGRAGKSLARPGRKQATATKLPIYTPHEAQYTSKPFALTFSSQFCKQIQKVVRKTRSPRQQ